MTYYAPGTQEKDVSKVIMSLQQAHGNTAANTTSIATNTADIATANANIATNTANIATNTTNIATQTAALAALTGSKITASLGSDTAISNAAYTDGPSVAQGTTGTWFASGTVTFLDTSGATQIKFKLYDGTTLISSASIATPAANYTDAVTLSGFITAPAGNIRIAATSTAAGATSTFKFNASGNSKDCTITAFRVA